MDSVEYLYMEKQRKVGYGQRLKPSHLKALECHIQGVILTFSSWQILIICGIAIDLSCDLERFVS